MKKRIAGMKTSPRSGRHRGFTLIEMIVGVGLFALLSLLVTTTFFYLVGIQRTVDSKQQVLNDFRLAIDVMVKEMTSGSAYPADCEEGCDSMTFTTKARPDMPQRNISYRWDDEGHTIEKAEQKTYGLCATLPFDERCYQPFASDEVDVESLKFFVNNKAELTQPIITIEIKGVILPDTRQEEEFRVTSSVTPRLLQDPAALPPSDNVFPTVVISSPTSNDEYSTDAEDITLGGTASDNVGLTEVGWHNEATGESGLIGGSYTNWTTSAIDLLPAGINVITIYAVDPAGNIGTDTLTITSTALPDPPDTPVISSVRQLCPHGTLNHFFTIQNHCDGAPATHKYLYRCTGTCVPPMTTPLQTGTPCQAFFDGPALGTYSYMLVNYDENTGQYSAPSAVRTATLVAPTSCTTPPPNPPTPPPPTPPGGEPPPPPGGDAGEGNFTLSANPTIIRVRVGGTTTTLRRSSDSDISVNPGSGFSDQVSFSLLTGAPSGTDASFNPNPANSPYSANTRFFVVVPDNTPLGTYSMTIRGIADDGTTDTLNIILDVAATGGGQQ